MRTERQPVPDPDAASARAERNRALSRDRSRRYRERRRLERRIAEQMERWGVDRARAIKQLDRRYVTQEEVERDRRLREYGVYDRSPLFPGKGFPDRRRTLRPRWQQRVPGTTLKARRRRLKVAAYRRRQGAPFTAPEDESGFGY